MHRKVSIIVMLLIFLSASYTQAKILPATQISVYDAARSQLLQNIRQNTSNSNFGNADLEAILSLSIDFAGRRYNQFTNQYFNRNRYYQPKYGRFTSKDPIGFSGDSNLYRYANSNPIIYTDPMGLMSPNESKTFMLGNWKINPDDPHKKEQIPNWPAPLVSPSMLSFNIGEKCAEGCGYWQCDLLLKFREILPNGRHKKFQTNFTESGDQTIIFLPALDLKFSVGFLTVTCKQVMMP